MKPQDREQLTRSILERTSGSPCGRARDLIGTGMDDAPAGLDHNLLLQHTRHCEPCRALAAATAWMKEPLRQLAELDPGPAFTVAVLRSTGPWHRRLAGRLQAGFRDWRDLMRRPRIAWESAYVGAALLALLFATPASPLSDVPGRALRLAQTSPVQALVEVSREQLPDTVNQWSRQAWETTGGRAGKATGAWAAETRDRLGRAWNAGRTLPPDLGQLAAALLQGGEEETGHAVRRVRDDVKAIFNALTSSRDATLPDATNKPESNQDSSGDEA